MLRTRSEIAEKLHLDAVLPAAWLESPPLVPVLRFSGPIGMATPLRPGVSLGTTANAIQRAFAMRGAKAVAIQINSPGGSAVQSFLIVKRIRALAAEKNLKVYVFAEDVAASGGYLLALAGDEIYAESSSIIGSIGVVSAGFGFQQLIEKIGVERRVHTAGERKAILDPFRPEREEDVERLKSIQRDVHADFIALVRERRSGRIDPNREDLFSGEFWSGREALALGLIDGCADVRSKMRELFGQKVRLKLIPPERSWFGRKSRGVSAELTASLPRFGYDGLADSLISAVEARALWSRFGL